MHKYICKILKHSIQYFFFKFTKITYFSGSQTIVVPLKKVYPSDILYTEKKMLLNQKHVYYEFVKIYYTNQ